MATGLGQLAVGHRIICDILETDSLKANEVHYTSTLPFVNDTTGYTTMEIQDEDFALTGKTIYAWGDDLANPGTTTDMFSVGCNALGNFEIYDLNNGQPRITINASTGNITFNPALPSGGGGGGGGGGGLTLYLNNASYPSNNTAPMAGGTLLLTPANYSTPQTTLTYSFVGPADNGPILMGTFTSSASIIPPNLTIPAGFWQLNAYTICNTTAHTIVMYQKIYYISGGTPILIIDGTPDVTDISLTTAQQLSTNDLYIPTTVVTSTADDIRIEVYIRQAFGNTNGNIVTMEFNDATISHLHTTIETGGSSTIDTTEISSAATYYPTMVSVGAGNQQAQTLYTDTGISFNSLTNNLTTTTFTGSLVGSATAIALTADNTYAGVTYIPYSKASSGSQALYSDTGLVYNPNNNQLTATTFNGNATLVNFNTLPGGGLLNLVACGGTTGASVVYPSNITYAPGTGTITTTTFAGNLNGNATTATTADLMFSITTNSFLYGRYYYMNMSASPINSVSPRFANASVYFDNDTTTMYCANFDGRATVANKVSPQITPTTTIKYLTFVENAGIDTELLVDKTIPLTYTPSTGLISSTSLALTDQINFKAGTANDQRLAWSSTYGLVLSSPTTSSFGGKILLDTINLQGGAGKNGASFDSVNGLDMSSAPIFGVNPLTFTSAGAVGTYTINQNVNQYDITWLQSGVTSKPFSMNSFGWAILGGTQAKIQYTSQTSTSTDYWSIQSTGASGTARLRCSYFNGSTSTTTNPFDVLNDGTMLMGTSTTALPDVQLFGNSGEGAFRGGSASWGMMGILSGVVRIASNASSTTCVQLRISGLNTTLGVWDFQYGGTSQSVASVINQNNTTDPAHMEIYHITAHGTLGYFYQCLYNNATIGGLKQTTSTTITTITSSDYRLKENIIPLDPVETGNKIDALKPCSFTWKPDQIKDCGFIAHEFAESFPNSVFGEKDAVKADGSIDTQMISVSSTEIVATLVAEIQFLRKRMAILEAKLNV